MENLHKLKSSLDYNSNASTQNKTASIIQNIKHMLIQSAYTITDVRDCQFSSLFTDTNPTSKQEHVEWHPWIELQNLPKSEKH